MERVLYYRLSWFIESQPILPQAQSGFRPFRACDDNLAVLSTTVKTGFLNPTPTVAVLLDVAGAFDNVNTHILVSDLFEIGVSAPLRKFVENLISYRQLSFIIDGELCGPFTSLKDTLQGLL